MPIGFPHRPALFAICPFICTTTSSAKRKYILNPQINADKNVSFFVLQFQHLSGILRMRLVRVGEVNDKVHGIEPDEEHQKQHTEGQLYAGNYSKRPVHNHRSLPCSQTMS